jgi:hypothetical protein
VYANVFKNAQTLHRVGYTVAYMGMLHDHRNCREDYEDAWQWFADSWATPDPTARTPPRASADSMPLLTEATFGQLFAFWQRLREEESWAYGDQGPFTGSPTEGPPGPGRVHRKELTVPFGPGRQPMQIMIADMPALAAVDTSIAADLKAVGLTTQQEEAARIAFINALVTGALAGQGLVQVEPTSVLGKNIDFLNARKSEVGQLQHKIAECHD